MAESGYGIVVVDGWGLGLCVEGVVIVAVVVVVGSVIGCVLVLIAVKVVIVNPVTISS